MPCRRRSRKTPKAGWTGEARECPICRVVFEQTRANQVYCSADCRQSRTNWTYAKIATANERGYGKEHREERARWKPIVDAGQAYCCLCGYWIEPGSKWHLDHNEDRTGYRGAAHAGCNLRDGARRGAQRTNATRRIEKTCDTCQRSFTTAYPKQRYCSRECRPKRVARSKPARAPKPQKICPICWAIHYKPTYCSAACGYEAMKKRNRDAYRLTHGIPLDRPTPKERSKVA